MKTAHWIIEDHGFGGSNYRCSNCHDSWNDIYEDVSGNEYCPSCKVKIDQDATEYIDETKSKNPLLELIEQVEIGTYHPPVFFTYNKAEAKLAAEWFGGMQIMVWDKKTNTFKEYQEG